MNAEEMLRGICDADRHDGGIRCLRLFRVEEAFFARLGRDVDRLCRTHAPSDVDRPEHITNWTRPFGTVLQYSLLNHSGRYDDFSADHELTCFGKEFHEAAGYPALDEFIAAFPHRVNFRINVLGAGAGLSPHEEHVVVRLQSGALGARLRFHLPISTSDGAELILDGDVHHLDAGTIYFVNHGCVHAARNRGPRARVHLVWDMLMTSDAFEMMFGGAAPTIAITRVAAEAPAARRVERMGAHRALPAPVDRDAVPRLCDPQ